MTTPTLKDILVAPDSHRISLKALTGKSIADIEGYITTEFGEPCFKLCEVVFEDGSGAACEGEHDLPYLVESYSRPPAPNLDPDTLGALDEQED